VRLGRQRLGPLQLFGQERHLSPQYTGFVRRVADSLAAILARLPGGSATLAAAPATPT
jgi:hypothetical protein